jgi:hypothetical protein
MKIRDLVLYGCLGVTIIGCNHGSDPNKQVNPAPSARLEDRCGEPLKFVEEGAYHRLEIEYSKLRTDYADLVKETKDFKGSVQRPNILPQNIPPAPAARINDRDLVERQFSYEIFLEVANTRNVKIKDPKQFEENWGKLNHNERVWFVMAYSDPVGFYNTMDENQKTKFISMAKKDDPVVSHAMQSFGIEYNPENQLDPLYLSLLREFVGEKKK